MAYQLLVQLVIFVVTTAISYALREKPDAPKSAELSDFEVPTASESRPIPVVFGTVRISGANVVWYGDLKTKKVKKSGGKK